MKNKEVTVLLQTVDMPIHLTGEGGYISNGKRWNDSTLFEAAEGLEVFDLPLCAIELNFSPWKMSTIKWIIYHIHRINDCDMNYPIIQCPDGVIIDGWHRVANALLNNKLTIKAIRLKVMPEHDRLITEGE